MRCPGCGRTVDWCNCAEHAEELELFQAQERAYWCDGDEPTGQYVWTTTERQRWEDEERRQDTGRREDE